MSQGELLGDPRYPKTVTCLNELWGKSAESCADVPVAIELKPYPMVQKEQVTKIVSSQKSTLGPSLGQPSLCQPSQAF